jgi:glyoxylase-like metal-dependent hydrolase (beta-lactamase superfamily II)
MSAAHDHRPEGKGPEGPRARSHPFDPGDPSAPGAGITVADGVIELDTLLGGWAQVTAGYLIEGDAPVLVETGSQSSVPVLLAQLEGLGLGASDLAGVVVTHIHLDHAGGVGDVARAFPKATVYVHQKGARHLADPTKLVDSASRVYGPLLDSLYGRLDPTPSERIHVLEDGEAIRVSSTRSLIAVDSPGHAKHHLGLHDSLSGVLFAGDAVGVKLPDAGVLRPSTPPPDFDLDLALRSLHRFAERRPTGLALAHYGLLADPLDVLDEADGTLRKWADVAETAFRNGQDIASALAAEFQSDLDGVPEEHREKLEVMNGVHSNAAGLHRWLSTRHPHGDLVVGGD